jgi:hypothetical protein
MNVFTLDANPQISAKYTFDTHVRKMTVEHAQICCSALDSLGLWEPWMYKPTHLHHPITKWAGENFLHWRKVLVSGHKLAMEFYYRFQKSHKTTKLYMALADYALREKEKIKNSFPDNPERPQPICLEDFAIIENDVVASYRNAYNTYKLHLKGYTRRAEPEWLI